MSTQDLPCRWVPTQVCHDMQLAEIAGRQHFVGITVTAEAIGEDPPPQLRIPADLGRKIADLVRAECGGDGDPGASLKP